MPYESSEIHNLERLRVGEPCSRIDLFIIIFEIVFIVSSQMHVLSKKVSYFRLLISDIVYVKCQSLGISMSIVFHPCHFV